MLNKLKFILLILLFLSTLSNAFDLGCGYYIIPKSGAPIGGPMYKENEYYTYKLAFDTENELYMYKIRKDGSGMEIYHYVRVQNNDEISLYKELSTQVFYRLGCAQSFPTLIYPLKKLDYSNDPKIAKAKFIVDVFNYDSNFAVQLCKLGYDLVNHKCADDCEHITDRELRFNCACNKQFPGSEYTGAFSTDPDVCKTPNITFTPKCCFGCGNGNSIVVNAANEYADYGCNYDEIDHLYLNDPKNPDDNKTKPDKPDNNSTKPDKPDNPDDNKTKPDKPSQGGGGHSGGGGGTPGNPDKPGDKDKDKDKNGTHPGGGSGGGKPGDKDDDDKNNPKMDFSDYDKLTKTVSDGVKKITDMYGDAKSQLQGAYDKIKNGSLSDFKPSGFVASCPYTRDFVIKDGLSKKITIDICAVVKDARSVLYFIFYAIFSTIFSILLFKIIIRLV
ncbi:MAG: hypothetical protein KH703_09385 [Campylobacter gracilis]|uniref:hypothetical protein n=1 Tax=Campylobacter gracilis TaxID=824 RepID=UPI0026F23F10|nr:hypothetical protein [Campylobacter gracilis]MBS6153582.1 hypothetical protein [Campylobacter gracilis]